MASKAKDCVKEKRVLSLPGPKHGPSLLQKTVDIVRSFYENDEIRLPTP